MNRRTTWFLAIGLGIAAPDALAQAPPEAADEARERKVMERFLAVLEKAPRRGTALDRVYGFHVERGSLDAFIKGYRDKVAADDRDGGSWLLVGLVEAQRGRDAAAVEAFRKAEAARPDDPLPAHYLGQALVLVGQPDAAAEAFERAMTRKPARSDLLDIYQALGRVHQRAHRNDKALAVWDRLEKAFPDDPRVQEQIAHALADEAQDAPALARFEALARSTRDRFRQVQFAIEAAELKVRLGKTPEALADFESLLGKLDPESWLYREVRRKVEDVFLRVDDLAGLAAYYERWITKTPDDVEAMTRLARTLSGQGRAADARRWLDRAVGLAPSRRELRTALIEQLAQDRKYAEAAAQYEALAKAEPNNPDVVRDWGRMLLRDTSRPEADRKRAAAIVWRRLAPDDSRDAVAVAQAADLFRQAGLTDEAIALYHRAIQLAPEASQYREYLGEYYHTLKRPAEALATWRATVEGPNRTARSLGRLGEVLAGFGYRTEAIEPLTEACRREPEDFDLRLQLADLKLALDRPLEALPELEKAETLAAAEEQSAAVLERLIRAYQTSGTLTARIEALKQAQATTATAAGWTRLALLLEADGKPVEAARAIGEATKLDPRSVPAWVATARLREAAGDLLGSAQALRTLTSLDRRSRTDYLTGIARLEARLGRKAPALEAGRELLAAAPGNPENHQFFAELCFGLGEADEGLDALRRAARANPSDPKAMLTLAENLARQFRTEEAIELFWRAFARTPEVEGKLSIVSRMTEQYLQRNQLDRLIGRLERELREPNQQRELSLCLAQAHSASGDNGTARLELERLLATSARDVPLLGQLSTLAETEGDLASAAKYQKQAVEIAPTPEGTARLAQLYLRSGEFPEAEAIWTRAAEGDQDPGRALSAIDSLLAGGKREPVLQITGRLLRDRPDDWELIYREGVALAGLGRLAEADRRFRALLALKAFDDEPGALGRSQSGTNTRARPTGTPPGSRPSGLPIQNRVTAAPRARLAAGIGGTGAVTAAFVPVDFGQARLGALAWRFGLALRENTEDAYLKERREARDAAPGDPRAARDWYYLQLVYQDHAETFEAAKALVKLLPSDADSQWAYLGSLTASSGPLRTNRAFGSNVADSTRALPPEEVDRVLACQRGLLLRYPEQGQAILGVTLAELKRAGRLKDAEQVYREAMDAAIPGASVSDPLINVAAERGDVDGMLAYLDKLERAPVSGSPGGGPAFTTFGQGYGRAIAIRGTTQGYPEVLAIFDRFLTACTRARSKTQAGASNASARTIARGNQVVSYWLNGMVSRAVAIDFPPAGDAIDRLELMVARTVFEIFRHEDIVRREDRMADLFAHLQERAGVGPTADRVDVLLVHSYLRWWYREKDEAAALVARAVEVAGPAPSPRLLLAEIQERRGSMVEALAAVDAIEALDTSTVLRRENLALRLAVAMGNVDRARKAAERLFGLRLDAETQIQLAALMEQLGMHDLAEAVLARARKSAGTRPPALLILMNQYQRQGKTELAIQVAQQILRLRPAAPGGPPMPAGSPAEDDQARREAMAILARSGKLKDLITRAEAQLERSPNSMQVLQTLVEYARVANDRDRIRSLHERMAATRPDDARLRLQVAAQLIQAGDLLGALGHYRAAIQSEPSTLAGQFFPIINAFRQADRIGELAAIVERIDLHAIGNNSAVANIAQNLMNDPRSKEMGLAMFRRIWATFPADRSYFINLLNYDEQWWRLPEVYLFARDVVLPSPVSSKDRPWWGVDVAQSYGNEGRVFTMGNRLLDAAARQDKLDELDGEVRRAMGLHPDWSAGRMILALIQLRSGRYDEARSTVVGLMSADQKPMPAVARWVIAQELEDHSPVHDLAGEIYEAAMRDYLARSSFEVDENTNPSVRLLSWYRSKGRPGEARDLLMKLAVARRGSPASAPSLVDPQRVALIGNYAQQLVNLGFSADAVRLYREQMATIEAIPDDLTATRQLGTKESLAAQCRQGLQAAIRATPTESLAPTVAALFRPLPGVARPAVPLELLLSVPSAAFEKESVTSGLAETIRRVVGQDGVPPEVASSLAMLREKFPDDFEVQVADVLLSFADGKPHAIDEAVGRLAGLVERSPLDRDISVGTSRGRADRPNARQQADAARQLGLWLVARDCWGRDETRARGDLFATRALAAARRQADPRWPAAMLREWGQVAIDRGDREAAGRLWGDLLELVLTGAEPRRSSRPPGPSAPVPSMTREVFDKVLAVATMAADRGLPSLSLRAVREAFRGGTPLGVQPGVDASNPVGVTPGMNVNVNSATSTFAYTTVRTATGLVRVRRTSTNSPPPDSASGQIRSKLAELEAAWVRDGVAPRAIYEVLRDVVLPPSRPSEVDLYPSNLIAESTRLPRSLGARLADWAVRAGAAGELREEAQARRGLPLGELSALVLLTQVDLASGELDGASVALDQIEARLRKETLKVSAELASHAAMPALGVAGSEKSAEAVLSRSIQNLAGQSVAEPIGSLTLALANHALDRRRLDEARKRFGEYLDSQDKSVAQLDPVLAAPRRKNSLLRVADEFLRRGEVPDALEMLGRFADIPTSRYPESSPNAVLAAMTRRLAALPPGERYRWLRAWTFPTADRNSVRMMVAFLPEAEPAPPAPFAVPPQPGGVVATLGLLVEAAAQSGKLDELAGEARALDDRGVEDARPLLILAEVARGRGAEVAPKVDAILTELGRNPIVAPNQAVAWSMPIHAFLVARACLTVEQLRPLGESLTEALSRRATNLSPQQAAIVAHLRRDLERGRASRAAGRDHSPSRDPGLAWWLPADPGRGSPFGVVVGPVWVEREGHLGLLSSKESDSLAFAIPLAGSFEFSVDTLAPGQEGDASIAFGGQTFRFRAIGPDQNGVIPPVLGPAAARAFHPEGFNRITLRAESGRVRCLVNGVTVAEEVDSSPTSPWLSLAGWGQTTWRAPDLVGMPEIPREVRLSHADRLEGWSATAYGETIAPRATGPDAVPLENFDWSSRDGVIRGRRLDLASSTEDAQSRLAQVRPLLDGESVSYTFLYEPGRTEVHPSLGRLAFLLEPGGVRLHWMTEGTGLDPSGLAPGNVVDDPPSRRGDGSIPLRPGAWNDVRVSMDQGTVTFDLNGVRVFERAVGPADDRTFGLFHFKDRTVVRVRDVVLRGDWAGRFATCRAGSLTDRRLPGPVDADRLAEHALIGEEVLVRNAGPVLRRSRGLADPARFESLAAWVLPGHDHPTFRLQGEFTPLDPAPIAAGPAASEPSRARGMVGGEPESPASDLVEVARSSGRLDELAARVEAAAVGSPVDERGRLALVAMVRMAQGRDGPAIEALARLQGLSGTIGVNDPEWMRWPELTAARMAMGRPKVRPSAMGLLAAVSGGPGERWSRQVRHARAIGDALERGVDTGNDAGPGPWSPIVRPLSAMTRGRGFPRPSWTWRDGEWSNESGPGTDALLLRVPLRGDFEATADLSAAPGRQAFPSYGGVSVRLRVDGKWLIVHQDGSASPDVALDPPVVIRGDRASWRVSVRQGRLSIAIDGRTVFERPITARVDPWLAIEAPGPLGGSIRNLSVTGNPGVPDSIRLSAGPDLSGWSASEYVDPSSNTEVPWRKRGDEIVGRPVPAGVVWENVATRPMIRHLGSDLPTGKPAASNSTTRQESVLRYLRPLLEDAAIEYEFFFEPGKAVVHPALGRLAFLIAPEGVSLHRLTDSPYDRTGLDPGNVAVETDRRRGTGPLPLRPIAWNHVKLTLAGDSLAIALNGEVVYERPIETTSSRTFGLFHYVGESEARVRNVLYQGEWPRSVPASPRPQGQ